MKFKKNLFIFSLYILMLSILLCSCNKNDEDTTSDTPVLCSSTDKPMFFETNITLKSNKKGNISMVLGMKKALYEDLKEIQGDPFGGRNTVDYSRNGIDYTAIFCEYTNIPYSDITEIMLGTTVNRDFYGIFKSASINKTKEKSDTLYSFYASFYPVQIGEWKLNVDQDNALRMNDLIDSFITVTMPENITDASMGNVSGKNVFIDIIYEERNYDISVDAIK